MAAATKAASAAKAAKPAPRRRLEAARTPVAKAARGRVRLVEPDNSEDKELGPASTYFADVEKDGLVFVSAGAAIIDCMLGGGYVLGRIVNIVGDRSAGKTLLAIEAFANFHMKFPKGKKRYAESEHAFDKGYAEALGMPVDSVEFVDHKKERFVTVEDFERDLTDFCERTRASGEPGIYACDSLDALSDDAEMGREIGDKATYGAGKAKQMSEMFRKLTSKLEEANVLLIVVSQLREAIGVMFGEKYKRSGGKALDFYASHIIWLREKGKMKQTRDGVERVIGVEVHARAKKNKVGLPFRECEYPILFGYGVDDLTANVEWLLEVRRHEILREEFGISKDGYKVRIANLRNKGGDLVREIRAKLREVVFREWQAIEQGFLPKARKY